MFSHDSHTEFFWASPASISSLVLGSLIVGIVSAYIHTDSKVVFYMIVFKFTQSKFSLDSSPRCDVGCCAHSQQYGSSHY